jgi:hypothetical protein
MDDIALGGSADNAGGKMKETGKAHWSPNTALPAVVLQVSGRVSLRQWGSSLATVTGGVPRRLGNGQTPGTAT